MALMTKNYQLTALYITVGIAPNPLLNAEAKGIGGG
jgi:hypothetical protein